MFKYLLPVIFYLSMINFTYSQELSKPSSISNFDIFLKAETISFNLKYKFGVRGPVNEVVYRPNDIKIWKENFITILDSEESNLKIFNMNGKYKSSISRKGQGPGEIGWARCFDITPSDHIVVHDHDGRRFIFFSENGQYKGFTKFSNIVKDFACISDSLLVVEQMQPIKSNLTRDRDEPFYAMSSLYKLTYLNIKTMKITIIDTICITDRMILGGGKGAVKTPLHPELLWSTQPSGKTVVIKTNGCRGEIYSITGVLESEFPLKIDIMDVTNSEIDEYLNSMNLSSNIANSIEFPDKMPICKSLFIDSYGKILLMGNKVKPGLFKYYLYTDEGVKCNEFLMPELSKHAIFYNKYIFDIVKPDDDFPYIAIYELN